MTGASIGRPFFPRVMTTMEKELSFAIFFCQQLDPDQDVNRRALEKELGPRIKFFPLPCSGRIEALHLMRALEAGADKVLRGYLPDWRLPLSGGKLEGEKEAGVCAEVD